MFQGVEVVLCVVRGRYTKTLKGEKSWISSRVHDAVPLYTFKVFNTALLQCTHFEMHLYITQFAHCKRT